LSRDEIKEMFKESNEDAGINPGVLDTDEEEAYS